MLLSAVLFGQGSEPSYRMKVVTGDGRTQLGDIDVVLLPSIAPLTVANFLRYVNRGSYNNTVFHRSVPGFVIQTGGYTLNGNDFTAKVPQDAPVRNEFNLSNTRGTLAMAKLGNNPNSATSEFFFNLADNSSNLNNQNGGFTVFARVANATSQAVVDRIASQPVPTVFNSPWDAMPLFNYRSGTPSAANIIIIQSITALEPVPLPAISSNGVLHATAFGGGAKAAPGSYLEIYGTALAGTTRSWTDADFSGSVAPTTLDSVQVTVGGVRAFVNFISPTQVNVQVPEGIPAGDSVPVVLSYNGLSSAVANIAIRDSVGGILAPPSFKSGDMQYAAAVHSATGKFVANDKIAGVENLPAVPGETLIFYGVGFGAVNPNFPPLGGRRAGSNPLQVLVNPVSFKFGDIEAKVGFGGLAPTFIGLYQFNVEVPVNSPTGDVALTISQNGAPIEQKLFLPVKAAN